MTARRWLAMALMGLSVWLLHDIDIGETAGDLKRHGLVGGRVLREGAEIGFDGGDGAAGDEEGGAVIKVVR